MSLHFHDLPRFREAQEPKLGPSIDGHRVTITVEEIPLGALAVIIEADVTCKGIEPAYGDGGSSFEFVRADITGLDGRKTIIGRPHPSDQTLEAHVWRAVVAYVAGAQDLCDRIMTLLEEAAS